MFSSLKIRNFRIYWLGMLISLIGSWVQITAQAWLVFDLTRSSFLLGIVGFSSYIPIFALSLFGGVAADRFSKRGILLVTQVGLMALAFVLGILVVAEKAAVWNIVLISLLNGSFMAFDGPARQAYIIELTGREHILNAVALNSAAFNSARIIGPALAGILIASVGMAGCFFVNAVSFLAAIAALAIIRAAGSRGVRQNKHIFVELWEGLNFIRGHRLILALMIIVAVSSLFGFSYVILMPVFADSVFAKGVGGLGTLMSSAGFGALIAALTIAGLGDFKGKGKLLMASAVVFSLALFAFSFTRIYWLSLLLICLAGWGGVSTMALVNTLLQINVPDSFRGRVMGLFMLTFAGMVPFGNLLAGSVAQLAGASVTLAIGAGICLAFFLFVNIMFPKIRDI